LAKPAAVALLAFACLVGTGGDTGLRYLTKRQEQGYAFVNLDKISEESQPLSVVDVRNPADSLKLIRKNLNLSMSEIAAACQVSRQAVYKWMSSQSSSLEESNLDRLEDLVRAADLFESHGVIGSPWLLKRKDQSGQSLIEAILVGRSAHSWADNMLKILSLENQQRAKLTQLGMINKDSRATEEWGVPVLVEDEP
jgi:transcriptional regulator with XRE-family HTH domain